MTSLEPAPQTEKTKPSFGARIRLRIVRVRTWFRRGRLTAATPAAGQEPPVDALRKLIIERIGAHAAAHSLDEARGVVMDRIIGPTCGIWAADARGAYERQMREWNVIENAVAAKLAVHEARSVRLGDELTETQGRYDRLRGAATEVGVEK